MIRGVNSQLLQHFNAPINEGQRDVFKWSYLNPVSANAIHAPSAKRKKKGS